MSLVSNISDLVVAIRTSLGTVNSRLDALEAGGGGSSGQPSLSLSVTAPTTGTVGDDFTGQATATNENGATGDISYSISGLPGVSIDADTGAISGSLTTAGSYTPKVTATNGAQSSTQTFYVEVLEPAAGPKVTLVADLPDGQVGEPYFGSVTGTNENGATGDITYSTVDLDPGLSLDPNTGDVTGSPTQSGTQSPTVTASNGTQSITKTFSFEVVSALPGISMVADLPAAPYGEVYSGSVTSTNIGGATGEITTTVDQLPGGLTIGGTVNGVVDVTGTRTEAEELVATFTSTNGTQTETLEHTFEKVSQPLTSVTKAEAAANNYDALNVTFTDAKEGDTIVVLAFGGASNTNNFTFSDDASQSYSVDVASNTSNNSHTTMAYTRVSQDTASIKVSVGGRTPGWRYIEAYLLRGKQLSVDTAAIQSFKGTGNADAPYTVDAYDPGVYDAIVLAFTITQTSGSAYDPTTAFTNLGGFTQDQQRATATSCRTFLSEILHGTPSSAFSYTVTNPVTQFNYNEHFVVPLTADPAKQLTILEPASTGPDLSAPVTLSGTTGKLVQAASSNRSKVVMPALATVGNLLVGCLSAKSASQPPLSLDPGWVLIGHAIADVGKLLNFYVAKIADGTEQYLRWVDGAAGATGETSAVQEWSGVKLSGITVQSIESTMGQTAAFGPGTTPAGADSVSSAFVGLDNVIVTTPGLGAGWTAGGVTDANNDTLIYGYSGPSDQPASGTAGTSLGDGTIAFGLGSAVLTLDVAATASIDVPTDTYTGGGGSSGDSGDGGGGDTGGGDTSTGIDPIEIDPLVYPATTDTAAPPGTDVGTHTVVVTVVDKDNTWTATSKVGDDPTIAAKVVVLEDSLGNPHRGLKAWFYADCVEIGANSLDNAYDFINCTVVVTYDGTPVAVPPSSRPDGTVDFWRGCRSPAIRYGTQVGWDAANIDWDVLMNYDRSVTPAAYNDSSYDYTFNGLGTATINDQDATGERNEIGPLPEWDVRFILNPTNESWAVVRRAADFCGGWRMVYTSDPVTGGIVDTNRYPNTGFASPSVARNWKKNACVAYGGSYDGNTLIPPADSDTNQYSIYVSACPNSPNRQHITRYAALAAMITKTARDRDHLAFWANWPMFDGNPAYRDGGVVYGAIRQFAWCIYAMFLASYYSSSGTYFDYQVDRNLTIANNVPKNDWGVWDISTPHNGSGGAAGYSGFGNQLYGYLAMVLDAMMIKRPDWKPLAQYIGKYAVTWFSKPYYPVMYNYTFICHDTDGNLLTTFDEMVRMSLISRGFTTAEAGTIVNAATVQDVYNALKTHSPTWDGQFVGGVSDMYSAGTSADSALAKLIAETIAADNAGATDSASALAIVQALPFTPTYTLQKFHLVSRTTP